MTDLEKKQRRYWTQFFKRPDVGNFPIKGKFNGRNVKYRFGAGRWLETIVNFGDKNIGVSLVLKNDSADDYFDRLQQDEHILRQKIGKELEFRRLAQQRTIRLMRDATDLEQRDTWGETHNWLSNTLRVFQSEFVTRLDGFDRGGSQDSPEAPGTGGGGPPRQSDPFLRQNVERAAVEKVTAHFTELGYVVNSVEKDNVGWDLEAIRNEIGLRLEVKGLSGLDISFELTPNEYHNMKVHRDSFQLCVVSSALMDPQLTVFISTVDSDGWISPDGRSLAIKEIVAARCQAPSH